MWYAIYDPEDELIGGSFYTVTSITQEEPTSGTYVASEAELDENTTYYVRDGALYEIVETVSTTDEAQAFQYFICYDADTLEIISVVTDESEAIEPYIATNVLPDDISNLLIEESSLSGRAGDYTENVYTLYTPVRLTVDVQVDGEDDGREAVVTNSTAITTPSTSGTIVRITLKRESWAQMTDTGADEDDTGAEDTGEDEDGEIATESVPTSVYVIAIGFVQQNSVLHVLGVNRGALRGDIAWESMAGAIQFTVPTGETPTEDVVLDAVIVATQDTWSAKGKIDAWPQGEWRTAQYLLTNHAVDGWNAIIYPGESALIRTPINFATATLHYLAAEWTGNTHVVLTQYYVGAGDDMLYYRLTNLSDQRVKIEEVILDIVYHGRLDGFVAPTAEVTAQGQSDAYITDEDIDGVT